MANPCLVIARIAATLFVLISVAACGQKGPLYMPDKANLQQATSRSVYATAVPTQTSLEPKRPSARTIMHLST